MGSAQSFGGSAYAAVSRNPHALPPGARGSAPGCVIPRLTSHPGSQATPRNRLTSDPATVPQDDPQPPHETASQATQNPHTTPRNHPTKPLRGFARTPDRGAISRDAGSRPRFAGTPFSSGVALPEVLVVRRSKRPTAAARHEQGWWDTT